MFPQNMPVPPIPLGLGPHVDWTPVGTVVAFAGPTQSSQNLNIESYGWMVCDGRTLEVSQYPELFAMLGYCYGGSASNFQIPDYRGYFLRMVDLGSGNDPDASQRTPAAGGTAEGVGSVQLDAIQTHEHIYGQNTSGSAQAGGGAEALPTTTPTLTTSGPTSSLQPPGNVRVSQNETRARNVYVTYLIKYNSMR